MIQEILLWRNSRTLQSFQPITPRMYNRPTLSNYNLALPLIDHGLPRSRANKVILNTLKLNESHNKPTSLVRYIPGGSCTMTSPNSAWWNPSIQHQLRIYRHLPFISIYSPLNASYFTVPLQYDIKHPSWQLFRSPCKFR